ncbi:MAG: hypothetical protein WB424_07275 [Terracidiphilus sp.]
MSIVKRLMEHQEEQARVATKIAVDAGVLKKCEWHDNVINMFGDEADAYKLGNYLFSNGKLEGVFSERTEMTDAIKNAIQSAGIECALCAKIDTE